LDPLSARASYGFYVSLWINKSESNPLELAFKINIAWYRTEKRVILKGVKF